MKVVAYNLHRIEFDDIESQCQYSYSNLDEALEKLQELNNDSYYNFVIILEVVEGWLMSNIEVGSKVRFFKKVVETETEIPLGSVGIVCDISNTVFDPKGLELTYYVVFQSLNNNDYFNVAELEYLGEV